MAGLFVVLPTVANGIGAAVDVSAMGMLKTVTIQSSLGVYEPLTNIEVSLDAAGANWSPLWTFNGRTEKNFSIGAHFMRTNMSRFVDGAPPAVGVGGTNDGTTFATPAVPAGNGSGAGVDISGLGTFKTIQVTGAFKGILTVEISEDAGASWSPALSFMAPGQQSVVFAGQQLRVTRQGVNPNIASGQPVVTIAGTAGGGGGGGGGANAGNPQFFNYAFTGAEGARFPVNLPGAGRPVPGNPYGVAGGFVLPNGGGNTFTWGVDTLTALSFFMTTSAQVPAGYKFSFLVEDLR